MTYSVVVPHDGSPASSRAIPVAAAFVRLMNCPLDLVRICLSSALTDQRRHSDPVVEVLAAPYLGESPAAAAAREAERCAAAAHELHILATGIQAQYGVSANAAVETSLDVVRGLLAYVGRLDPALIVMATHARIGISRAFLGSVADAISRESHVPVVLVPERPPSDDADYPLRRILVAVDGSAVGETIIDQVAALVRGASVALRLFSVVLPALVNGLPAPAAMRSEASDAAALSERAAYLDRLASRIRAAGRRVDTHVLYAADVAGAIQAAAAEADGVDLIAMATHARWGLQRLVRGSVADQVLHGAVVPVLLLHPAGWVTPAGSPATSA